MPIKLEVEPVRNGSLFLTCNFYDEDDLLLTSEISSLTWTLTKPNRSVINSRSGVTVATPSSPVSIRLSGEDLDVSDQTDLDREILFKGVYNSAGGSDNPLRERAIFKIEYSFGEDS